MRVAIVENTAVTHHGQVGVALHEAGALVDLHRPFLGQPLPDAFDALVVFGGEQSALDDAAHPYLPRLADLMARSARAGLPVLGICLGAQVLARGMGARNLIGATPEFGWCGVERLAGDDPLMQAVPARFPIFQWHSDTFTLPPGCAQLARADGAEVQAFRAGPRAWGTQFHFEASRVVVADWARRFPEGVDRMDPAFRTALPARAAAEGLEADAAGLALARAFVAQIGA
ncbi:MAG TPA: type 1 glutamine amidotransferase [Paracoccaceae bacterium]|nr:type 1 glutamine amidotransferase [Paracoccaceae bacterium]HMO72164.1 type 1 glutamine amidotransferase [Paracoccaceae bacterium]